MKEDRYWNRVETVGDLIDILKQTPPLKALRVANGHCNNDDCQAPHVLIYNDED